MGSIVTFYSFKGGVGRSMALANVAVLLAQTGKTVLMVDWDLEAPGLHRYFDHRIQTQSTDRGLLDLLRAGTNSRSGNAEEHSWQSFVSTIYLPDADRLDILTAGHTNDEQYLGELQEFDREKFSGAQEGGRFIESLRNEWRRAYDVVLIDSRIGYRRGLPHWMAPTSSQLAPLTRKPTALTPRGGPPGLVQMCLRETSWRPELMWSASSPAVSEPTGTSYRGEPQPGAVRRLLQHASLVPSPRWPQPGTFPQAMPVSP